MFTFTKKHVSALLALSLALLCALSPVLPGSAKADEPLCIVCSTFPQYDWTRQILGERAQEVSLTLLLDSGVDLHSYQPTAADIARVAAADLFIYTGGESDRWVDGLLEAARNPGLTSLSTMACVEAKQEEAVEGMQAEEEEHAHDGDEEESPEYDEHVWLSLRNAQTITRAILDALCALDPDHEAAYRENAEAYLAQLAALDEAYQAVVDSAARTTILFADRFPFRYLADDYGLTYYAAFMGCSAETEASFETIAFLARKTDELQLPAVLVIEGTDHSLAETVVASTSSKNQQILVMNSLQSVTARDLEDGVAYLDVMTDNLDVLRQALS